jgi:hypothetical protein
MQYSGIELPGILPEKVPILKNELCQKNRLALVMDGRDAWASQPMIMFNMMGSGQAGSALPGKDRILMNTGNSF